MHISRDNRGDPRLVNRLEDRGGHGSSRHTRPTVDRPTWPEFPLSPRRGLNEPSYYPPSWHPPRNIRPPARPPGPANTAHRHRPRLFDEKRGPPRDPRHLFEEARDDVTLDTGTAYPCTKRDLDATGGMRRFFDSRKSHAELKAMWFSEPNTGPKVGIKQAALDIVHHNAVERIPSVKEEDAIDRLCIMLDNASQGHWGPDVAIKCFCDLDTVFFRGKLRGHVCVTWAGRAEFEGIECWGMTTCLFQGKALIRLNAKFIFRESRDRPLQQTLGTLLHEMW